MKTPMSTTHDQHRRWLIVSALACLATSTRAQTWMFVDDGGVVHMGNQRAPDGAPGVTWLGQQAKAPLPLELPSPDRLVGYRQVREPLRQAASAVGLDHALVAAVAAVESAFDPAAVSPKGAVGLMQIMPGTAIQYGVPAAPAPQMRARLQDPVLNAAVGSRILSELLTRFEGQLDLALAAYNAGEGAVRRHGQRIPPFRETEQYVLKVLRLYARWLPLV